jgi:hypothetical protein
VAALASADDVEGSWLRARLDDAFAVVAGRFFRREVRVRARACLGGMLSGLERKTSWSLAEHAGETTPDGMQRLFTTARWDPDLVRDDVRGYVAAALGDPDGVLIGDDTGFREEGDALGGSAAAAHGHGREDHELPAGGVPGLCRAEGAGSDRPGPLRRAHHRRYDTAGHSLNSRLCRIPASGAQLPITSDHFFGFPSVGTIPASDLRVMSNTN